VWNLIGFMDLRYPQDLGEPNTNGWPTALERAQRAFRDEREESAGSVVRSTDASYSFP